MVVLAFGTYDVRAHPRVTVLIEGLRAAGQDVVEANVPLGLETSGRVRILRHPWLAPLLVLRILGAWLRLWSTARTIANVGVVLVGYMGHFDVHLARRMFPRATIALDHLVSLSDTALDRGARGLLVAFLATIDRAALRAADVPIVDTQEHLDLLPAGVRGRAVVVSVGAPRAWFRRPNRRRASPMRVIFFGVYTPLQGAPVIARAIAQLADAPARFTMCGHGQEHAEARRLASGNPHVDWIDWVDAEELPDLVAIHDVCLGIFGTSAKARRVVPNKVYQGAAAGCAVVTSDTRSQRAALGRAAIFVPPGDHMALAEALGALAANSERLWHFRLAAAERAHSAFRPESVVAPLHERLSAAPSRDG